MPQVKKKSFIQKNGLIAVWAMAGFVAMGYIGFLATGNNSLSSDSTLVAQNGSTPSRTPVSTSNSEVAELRARVQDLTNREKTLSRKLSNIEEALGPNTAALPDKPTGYGIDEVARAKPKSADLETTRTVSINVLPLTQDDKINELINNDQLNRYGVDLASARSIDSLQRHWIYLKKKSPKLFKGLKPQFIDKGTPDLPLFSLIVGPFERMSDARNRCKALSKANVDCQETHYQVGSMQKIKTAGRDLLQ